MCVSTNEGARAGGGDWHGAIMIVSDHLWQLLPLDWFRKGNPTASSNRPSAQQIENAASVVGLYDGLGRKEYPMRRCLRLHETGWKHFVFISEKGAQSQRSSSSIIFLLDGAMDAEEEPFEVALAP
jgi:hypothetical protein